MKTNQEYKNSALERLRGNWAPAGIATIIYLLVALVITGGQQIPRFINADTGLILWFGGASLLFAVLIVQPLEVGYSNAVKLMYERRDYEVTRKVPGMTGMKMPDNYIVEMFCDRIAASKIYKGNDYTDSSALEY